VHLFKRLQSAIPFLIWAAYPLTILFGLMYLSPRYVALLLAVLLIIKWRRDAALWLRSLAKINSVILLVLLFVITMIFILNSEFLLRLYPVLVNLSMLVLFVSSLRYPPSIIESFARLETPDLTFFGIQYTRTVTKVWCIFFFFNGVAALYTAHFSNQEIWALYNGFIAYVLIGILFVGEWAVRQKFVSRLSNN
tara:strand:- start:15329 stop:15910 length:582 start_codon:yes stop_codon:yes gene_type:complete